MKPLHMTLAGPVFIAVWSSGYVVGAKATEVMAPLTVTFWRFLLAAAVLAGIAVRRREAWPRGRQLARVAAVGVPLFALQFGALYTALAEGMPASTTALIACSSPLLVAAIGAVARWEHLTRMQWLGIALGVVGVAVTLADRVGRPPSLAVLGWALLGLAALAGGTVMQSRLRSGTGPAAVASVELAAGATVLAVWAPLKAGLGIPLTGPDVGWFLWLALVTGVGAPLLLFALIRQRGATAASSLLFLVPAVTAFVGWPVLGTPVGLLTLAGLLIAGGGLWLLRPIRRSVPSGATSEPDVQGVGAAPRLRREVTGVGP